MGLRKPSGWQTFTAQAYAGAGQQQKAREEMKEPGKTKQALGGAGSVGTSMVAATTGAQQAATKQMQETATQASKDLKVDPSKIGTATVSAIGGTPTTSAKDGTQKTEYTGGATATEYKPSAQEQFGRDEHLGVLAISGDTGAIESNISAITTEISNIEKQMSDLDEQLKTANAQDAQKIQAEKDRLNDQLDIYRKKLSEENLGKIADQSTFETDMEDRERTLAQKGNNVGKLAALFGRRGVGDQALASQVYGKDLENIQKAAAQGLISKEQAEQAAAEAETQYSEQLDKSKEGFEKTFEGEERKLELLKMSPEELKGVTQEEVEKLFGKEMADRLFDYKDGYVSDAHLSKTRKILADNLKAKQDEKTFAEKKLGEAKTKFDEMWQTEVDKLLGTAEYKGEIDAMGTFGSSLNWQRQRLESIKNTPSWRRAKGDSTRTWNLEHNLKIQDELIQTTTPLKDELRQLLKSDKNRANLNRIKELQQQMRDLTDDAQRRLIKNPTDV